MTCEPNGVALRRGALDAVAAVKRIIVPTDDHDAALARARAAAIGLAARFGADLVLYDRSGERWTDTPHPEGPLGIEELDPEDHSHLIEQLRACRAAGVDATVYLATIPALTAMLDALQELEIDCVVLPDGLDDPKMMDRLQLGSDPSQMVQRVAQLQLNMSPVMLVVDDEDVIDVAPPMHYPS